MKYVENTDKISFKPFKELTKPIDDYETHSCITAVSEDIL
jgi:hypothetical protein